MRGSSTDIARGRMLAAVAILASALLPLDNPCSTAAAQEPDSAVTPVKPSLPPRTERNLLTRTGWIRLEIVGGRVAVLGHRCGQSRVVQVGEPGEIPYEQLAVQLQSGSLILHYEDLHADRELKLDLDDQQRLIIRQTTASPTGEVKLVQPFKGPITLTIGRDSPQTYNAATLWHLALQQPQLCEEQLFPLLETLRPHWRLKELAAGIQQELLSHAGEDVLAERAQWREWLAQLDSDDFQERQTADRHLRGAGQGVIAWLQRLDKKQLSAEQKGRIQNICQGLADLSNDSPERVAAWLLDDRCAWLALLRSEDAAARIAASNHLTLLFGKPLPFNPLGDLSDREQQIAQLQVRFGR